MGRIALRVIVMRAVVMANAAVVSMAAGIARVMTIGVAQHAM